MKDASSRQLMNLNKTENKTSKAAILITSLYLSAVIASFIVMLVTAADTPMSGIFLIMITAPWSLLLSGLLNIVHLSPTPLINGLFLLIGGAGNSYILYKLISIAAYRFK